MTSGSPAKNFSTGFRVLRLKDPLTFSASTHSANRFGRLMENTGAAWFFGNGAQSCGDWRVSSCSNMWKVFQAPTIGSQTGLDLAVLLQEAGIPLQRGITSGSVGFGTRIPAFSQPLTTAGYDGISTACGFGEFAAAGRHSGASPRMIRLYLVNWAGLVRSGAQPMSCATVPARHLAVALWAEGQLAVVGGANQLINNLLGLGLADNPEVSRGLAPSVRDLAGDHAGHGGGGPQSSGP